MCGRLRSRSALFSFVHPSASAHHLTDYDGKTLRGSIKLEKFKTVALPAGAMFELTLPDRAYRLQTDNNDIGEAHKCVFAHAD
jgi:hypothetical protein